MKNNKHSIHHAMGHDGHHAVAHHSHIPEHRVADHGMKHSQHFHREMGKADGHRAPEHMIGKHMAPQAPQRHMREKVQNPMGHYAGKV